MAFSMRWSGAGRPAEPLEEPRGPLRSGNGALAFALTVPRLWPLCRTPRNLSGDRYFLLHRLNVVPEPFADSKSEGRGFPAGATWYVTSSPSHFRMPRLTRPFPAPARFR